MSPDLWYPGANRSAIFTGCGPFVFGPARGVLHTTEGDSAAGAIAAYKATGDYPHFTVDGSTIYQHVGLSVGSTALVHNAGTIDTNRASAIQIEIVGRAINPPTPPLLVPLMRWIEAQVGIQWVHPEFGVRPARFTDDQWRSFNGWCGHEHVPHQDPTNHWDPGALDIDSLAPQHSSPLPPAVVVLLGENKMRMQIVVPIGKDGNGWAPAPIDFSKVEAVFSNAPNPARDGYRKVGEVTSQQEDDHTIVVVEGGNPGDNQVVFVTYTA